MKPRLKDYLIISMALLAIFLCGYGIGFLLGEKRGRQTPDTLVIESPSAKEGKGLWVERTLARFDRELKLTPTQKKAVAAEIEKTYDEIRESRQEALLEYSKHILELHTQLIPHLDEAQKASVEKQRQKLRQTLDLDLQ